MLALIALSLKAARPYYRHLTQAGFVVSVYDPYECDLIPIPGVRAVLACDTGIYREDLEMLSAHCPVFRVRQGRLPRHSLLRRQTGRTYTASRYRDRVGEPLPFYAGFPFSLEAEDRYLLRTLIMLPPVPHAISELSYYYAARSHLSARVRASVERINSFTLSCTGVPLIRVNNRHYHIPVKEVPNYATRYTGQDFTV